MGAIEDIKQKISSNPALFQMARDESIRGTPGMANAMTRDAAMAYNAADPESVKRYQEANRVEGKDVDTTAAMNQGIGQAKQSLTDRANMTPEQIAAQSMEGVDKSSQLPNEQNMAQRSAGLGGAVDAGMSQAIANRQAQIYGSSINNISQNAKMRAVGDSAARKSAALAGMASVEDLKTQAANTQLVKYQNDQAKRNSILNAILGLGGAIGGMVTGVGAAAGSAIAQGVGKLGQGGGGNTQVQALDSGGNNSASYFGGKR